MGGLSDLAWTGNIMKPKDTEENRGRQIFVGMAVIGIIAVLVIGLLLGWRLIPGWVGEAFGMVAGVLSTPFLMEGSFIVIGLLSVLGLNIWRRRKEGDEFVEIESGGNDGTGASDLK